MKIKIKIDGKIRMVSVRDNKCKDLSCFVPSSCNSPGAYSCRIRDCHGCPTLKKTDEEV